MLEVICRGIIQGDAVATNEVTARALGKVARAVAPRWTNKWVSDIDHDPSAQQRARVQGQTDDLGLDIGSS
jgi:hypothetical protein